MSTPNALGERIRGHRLSLGLRQRDVATALDVTEAHISKWESGTCKPSFDNCCNLAAFLGVTLDYLMTGRDPEPVASAVNE